MKVMKQQIATNADGIWLCICGNTPSDAGFYPIDNDVTEVEPTDAAWHTGCYFCANCGRVIDLDQLTVLRKVPVGDLVRLG